MAAFMVEDVNHTYNNILVKTQLTESAKFVMAITRSCLISLVHCRFVTDLSLYLCCS